MTLIQPKWNVEPTLLFVVSYFPTNATNTKPSFVDPVMYDHATALEKAKQYVMDNNNIGVCTIQQTACEVIYPATGWVDF